MQHYPLQFLGRMACLLLIAFLASSAFSPSVDATHPVQNLRAFAKLYGYVRYFHPSDEASQLDWDKFALHGVNKVKAVKTNQELQVVLKDLFLPVAPTLQVYQSGEPVPALFVPASTEGLRVVTWQHKGIALNSTNPVYSSVRTNRENKLKGSGGFGTVIQSLDAKPYRGKEVKLTAFVKTNVTGAGNQGQLWLRVDRSERKTGFFYNMQDRPIQSATWQAYEITGKVDDDAESLVWGGFLLGTGKVWLDDFTIEIKNANGQWEPVSVANAGFEEGKIGQAPKSWKADTPGYSYKIVSDDKHSGNGSLLIENKERSVKNKLFDKTAQPGETVTKSLDNNLYCRLPLALYSDERRTLGPKPDTMAFHALQNALKTVDLSKLEQNPDLYLANVVIAWNIFQHFYPYFDVVKTDWEAGLTTALQDGLDDQSARDCLSTLQKMVTGLKDGHGNVYHAALGVRKGLPFLVEWIENQVVIVASESDEFKKGDVIISLDGIPAKDIITSQEALISGSPQWKRYRALQAFSVGEAESTATVEVRRGKQALKKTLARTSTGKFPESTH